MRWSSYLLLSLAAHALAFIGAQHGELGHVEAAVFPAGRPIVSRELFHDADGNSTQLRQYKSNPAFQPPWLAPLKIKFRYTGEHNKLKRMLEVQAKNKWITVFVFSASVQRWALNAIYSYMRIGLARSYIVATLDEESLVACQKLRLPCFNASYVFEELDRLERMSGQTPGAGHFTRHLTTEDKDQPRVMAARAGNPTTGSVAADTNTDNSTDPEACGNKGGLGSVAGSSGGDSGQTDQAASVSTIQSISTAGARKLHAGTDADVGTAGTGSDADTGTGSSTAATYNIGTRQYVRVTWAKVVLLRDILKVGFNVHISDVDVVYLRDVYRSFNLLFYKYRADAIFMKENMVEVEDAKNPMSRVKRVSLLNTGVYVMRSTNTTIALAEAWLNLSAASIAQGLNDQVVFNRMAFKMYAICSGTTACASARMAGWPAVIRHPQQFGQQVCPGALLSDPCDPIRLYIHAVCTSGWGSEAKGKGVVWSKFKLWLVDEEGTPLYVDPLDGDHGQNVSVSFLKGGKRRKPEMLVSHPWLPCKGPAWNFGRATPSDNNFKV